MKCRKCRFSYLLKNELWCDYISDYVREDSSCENGEFPEDYDEPQTNGDKVRAMTDEQLAQFILNTIARICAKVAKKNEASIKENFAQAGLYCQMEIWLKERADVEAEEGDGE